MSSSEDVLAGFASLSTGAVPYKTFLSDLSETNPALQSIQSYSLQPEAEVDRSAAISKFSLLLSTLRVPGPCSLFPGYSPLGSGAQFSVVEQDVNGLANSKTPGPPRINSTRVAAIKTPHFILDEQEKLDLSSPEVSRQVRNMIIEITALCHPGLRDHRNIVDLLGWGTNTETLQQVPFLTLELADITLAAFLCESMSTPVALRHHLSLDIGCGLDAVHDIGLIHGDLKPNNVLMFYRAGCWVAKLADFGGGADTCQGDTLQGRGTVGWRAPEFHQFSEYGKPLDRSLLDRIDSYSYGLMLWSLFLRDRGSVPCTEDVDAEMAAISELENNPTSLPISLHSALKASLCLSLKKSPRERVGKVGHLLDDGSWVYSEWALLQSSGSGTYFPEQVTDCSTGRYHIQYDWELPEISMHSATSLRPAFSRNEPLSAEIMQALFMKSTGYDRRCHLENNHSRDLILGLLHAGAQKGSQPLRALIYVVHEHFQVLPRADIAEAKLLWISEAVAGGAFFLRKALQRLDSSLLETSIRKFRNHGGYNQFYAAFNRKSIEDILGHTSVENALDLNRKASLNSRGDKLLHILSSVSASPGLENILKLMDPREVNIANGYGETALYRACMVGETSNVLLLLSHGADPSIVPSCGGPTCLHWLFNFSPEEIDTIAKELVRHGSQIHSCSEQKIPMLHYPFTLPVGTPLHWAVEMSVAEAICSLLRLGADPSFRDGSDPYAYDENVRQLDMSLPPDLVGYSVAKNTTLGFSAIDVAVKNRDHEILDMLLSNDSGVDVNDTDEEGYSALHRLDAGEWRYTTQGTAVWCPLFQGPTVTREDSSRKTVAVLVQHGFELDKLTKPKGYWESDFHISGQTALMIAVAKGNCETIKILLDAGADVNIANTEGETALLSFTDAYADDKARQCKFVSLLLHANANLHARNSMHQTPVRLAALQGLEEVIMALLQHGADIRDLKVDTHARRGVNPWHYLSICQSQRIAEHDAWFVSLLDLHILPRLAQPDGLEIRNELLEKADPREGTLLHLFARAGLVRSCAALVQANVPINSLRRRKKFRRKEFKSGVTSISYMTPLDDSLKGGRPRPYGKVESEQERAKRMTVFKDTAKVLRDAGGVQGRDLVAKEYFSGRVEGSDDEKRIVI